MAADVAGDKPVIVTTSAVPELEEFIEFVDALAEAPIEIQLGLAAPPDLFNLNKFIIRTIQCICIGSRVSLIC